MASPERVVLVGGGLACTRVAQELQRLGSTAHVVLVSEEQHPPYDRPPLSKQVLRGEVDAVWLHDDWAGLGVELRLGRRAVALHADRRSVLLDDGEELPYDALVVGTGAAPRQLPGLSGPGVHVLRTLDDASGLRADMTRAGRVTVVGGGFIGCEVAASARDLGHDVTLVELLPQPLARVLGVEVGGAIAELHAARGVDLRRGVSVLEARGEPEARELLLSDGSTVDGRVVCVGLGVAPTTGWLDGSGVEVEDGVVCDARGRTSLPGVWAVGDVARWQQPATGEARRIEHWTSAGSQGPVVARDLLGDASAADLDEVPYVWSDQYGLLIQVVGAPHPDDDVELRRVGDDARVLAVWSRDGGVTGVLGAGLPKPVRQLRKRLAAGPVPLADALELIG